jgi:hypothetical protein
MEAGLPTGAQSFVTFSRPCRGAKRAARRRQVREVRRYLVTVKASKAWRRPERRAMASGAYKGTLLV